MVKLKRLLPLLAMLLAGCANSTSFLQKPVTNSEQAKQNVPFCEVAKPSWGRSVPNDPELTQAQKAAYNATGKQLCSNWPDRNKAQ